MSVSLPKEEFSGDLTELDEKIKSLIGQGENMIKKGNQMIKAYVCQVCGKEGLNMNIKRHVEANHIEGISIPCNLCKKSSSSGDALLHHKVKHHKSYYQELLVKLFKDHI